MALLCLIVGNSMHAYTYNYDFGVDGLYYNINDDGETVTITHQYSYYIDKWYYSHYEGDIVVPETVTHNGKTYTVTTIGHDAFYDSPALTSVWLPNTITNVQSGFSNCVSLTEIHFGTGLTELPGVSGCISLQSIHIPANIQTIPYGCFSNCTSLTQIVFEDGDKDLEFPDADRDNWIFFKKTPSLKKVYIGRNIITPRVFSECASLESVTFGPTVTKICNKLFENCSSLSSISTNLQNYPKDYDAIINQSPDLTETGNIVLDLIEAIGSNAFYNCESIKQIELPSIETLGSCAFECSNGGGLEVALIGNKLKTISLRCFYGQKQLSRVYVGTALTTIDGVAFNGCTSLTDLYLFSNDLVSLATNALPTTLSKIYVIDPSRYDNLLKDYYRDYLITLNPCTAEYSGSAPTFSFVNNVANTDVAIVPSSINVNVGEYNTPISLEFSNGSWSSTISVKASYTITPAQLTIIANDATKVYGTPNPPLTCSYFGFKNGESTDALTTLPSIETTATTGSNVGTYPIIPVGATAQNYTFNYERGTLTITKADQTITWNQQFGTVNVGDVVELTATSSAGLPIKYTSTDESVAEIYSQNGRKYVEFLKSGNVMLRANQEGNENYNEADRVSKSVSVAFLVTNITLNNNSLTLEEGQTVQLTASVLPEQAHNKAIQWSSSNTSVATVDSNGYVTAIKQGSAVIYAKSTDGSDVSAQCTVKVIKLVEGISLNITSASINIGQAIQLQATIEPNYADNQTIKWSSDNATVASVDQSGNVTALSKGEATITAQTTDGSNLSATCRITVIKLVSSIVLSKSQLSIEKGESTTLTAKVTPTDATNTALQWSSMNEAIATVDNGVVTAVSCGKTKIIVEATDGSGIYAECEVEVTDGAGINDASYYEAAVSVSNSRICIENAPNGTVVRIIQSDGREVFRHTSTGEQITYEPSTSGIYLVIIGTKSYKIALN